MKGKVFEGMGRKRYVDGNGYERFADTGRLVHREVAYEQIYLKDRQRYAMPFRFYEVHHKDENKRNNRRSNLEVLTHEQHRKAHERKGLLARIFS